MPALPVEIASTVCDGGGSNDRSRCATSRGAAREMLTELIAVRGGEAALGERRHVHPLSESS